MDALRIRRRIEGIGRIGETGGIGKSNYLRCLETFQQGVRGSSRNEQPSEPGPQGGVGEGIIYTCICGYVDLSTLYTP